MGTIKLTLNFGDNNKHCNCDTNVTVVKGTADMFSEKLFAATGMNKIYICELESATEMPLIDLLDRYLVLAHDPALTSALRMVTRLVELEPDGIHIEDRIVVVRYQVLGEIGEHPFGEAFEAPSYCQRCQFFPLDLPGW